MTFYCTASVWHCVLFLLTLKKTHPAIYVYICLPRNSACVVKRKQTWPEQAVFIICMPVPLSKFCNVSDCGHKLETSKLFSLRCKKEPRNRKHETFPEKFKMYLEETYLQPKNLYKNTEISICNISR